MRRGKRERQGCEDHTMLQPRPTALCNDVKGVLCGLSTKRTGEIAPKRPPYVTGAHELLAPGTLPQSVTSAAHTARV